MDRYWKENAVTNAPAVPDSNAGGFPADGVPSAGVEGTVPGAWWYHSITEEIRNAILKLGGTPDWTKTDQLGDAINLGIEQSASVANYTLGVTGAINRTVQDRLRDAVDAKDFGIAFDGVTDDSAAWASAWAYITKNGKLLRCPAGVSNVGTFRFAFTGASSGFGIVGAGAGVTKLVFSDIPPTATSKSEKPLFSLTGSNKAPIYDVLFANFLIDYSAQTNKGGATLDTLALTDIKPYASGCRAVYFNYCVGITISGVNVNELYGDGFIGSYSPYTLLQNCRLYNVSGGNPGTVDDFGGGWALVLGCFGSVVLNVKAFNERVYLTDTIGGYCTITSKNTPCGYIGGWTEFPMNQNNSASTLPPYANRWLTGVIATDRANFSNDENFGTVVYGCLAYGYTLGFKAEGGVPTLFDGCTAINCWIPFSMASSRGVVTHGYADCMNLDGLKCPMDGYQYVRALYLHYNVNNPQRRYAGFTFDGCMSHTHSTPVFTDNAGYGKFLNQQTWIDSNGINCAQLFNTHTTKTVEGVEIRGGHIQIEGLGSAYTSQAYDTPGLVFDVTVSNLSAYPYTFQFTPFYWNCHGMNIRIAATGLVGVQLGPRTDGSELHATLSHPDVTKSFAYPASVVACAGANISARIVLNTHSAICSPNNANGSGFPLAFTGASQEIDVTIDVADAGVNTLSAGLIGFNSANQRIKRVIKTSDVYGNPVLWYGVYAKSWHLEEANSNDAGPIVNNAYPLVGPITLGPLLRGHKLWKNALTSEPNSPSKLANGLFYPEGLTVLYLKPALGGAMGWTTFSGGQSAAAWAAGKAYSENSYVHASGQVYQCTVSGTSGAVAPSGQGVISDGGATWTWVAPFAAFVEFGSYASAALA